MATTSEYLTQLQNDKATLVDNLNAMGVSASDSETFTSLVPKVLNIETSSGNFIIGTYTATAEDVANKSITIPFDADNYDNWDVAIIWRDYSEYFSNKDQSTKPSFYFQLFKVAANDAYTGLKGYSEGNNYLSSDMQYGSAISCSRFIKGLHFYGNGFGGTFQQGSMFHYIVARLS